MRITEAARQLGTSPRMLRYRESLGLLPPVRELPAGRVPRPTGAPAGRPARPQPGRLAAAPTPPEWPAPSRVAAVGGPGSARHRRFNDTDLDAVSLGLAIERRHDVSPAALAFGLKVLIDPLVRAEVSELGRRIGKIRPLPALAMDFEKERAHRLLVSPAEQPRGSSRLPSRFLRGDA